MAYLIFNSINAEHVCRKTLFFGLTQFLSITSFICLTRSVFQLSLRVKVPRVYHGIMPTASLRYPHLQLLRSSQAGILCQMRIREPFLILLKKMLATMVRKSWKSDNLTHLFLLSNLTLFILLIKNKLRVPSARKAKMIWIAAKPPG